MLISYTNHRNDVMKQKQTHIIFSLIIVIFSSAIFLSISSVSSMADSQSQSVAASSSEAKVHIIYTEKPEDDQEPEDYHIKTLTRVLGSEEAAKESLVYIYKNAATGFSAKLTPDQVSEITKQPGVIQVVPSQTLQLHSGGPAKINKRMAI